MNKPIKVAALDTETFYENKKCTVEKLGAHAYTRHPDFEVFCVSGYSTDLADAAPWAQPPESVPWDEIHGLPIVAHNVAFDRAVLRSMPGFPDIPNDQWYDSAALCAYHQYPRHLAGAAKEILGVEKSKAVRTAMQGKRMEDLDEEATQEFWDYAKDDAKLCHDVFQRLYPITPSHEIKLSQLAVDQGERGIAIDRELLNESVSALETKHEEVIKGLPWVKEGYKIGSPIGLRQECLKAGIEPPASTAVKSNALEVWLSRNREQAPWIKALHDHRSINRILKTLEMINTRLTSEDILQFGIKYCGSAATGRFSGDQGVNLLNLNKNAVHGVRLRHLFTPRPGHKFIICDLAQIEPRCLAWLTGDKEMLDAMNAGQDIYEAHARSTMGYADPRPLKEVDNELRQMAKVRVLSMGYGLGPARHAENMGIPEDQAEKEIADFRKSAKKTSGYWATLQNLFVSGCRTDGELELDLPSGRSQKYFGIKKDYWTVDTGKKEPEKRNGLRCSTTKGDNRRFAFWGSKLCENVCQGVARDVFCHGLLGVLDKGIDVPFTVYDELVAEVPEGNAVQAMKEIEEAMTKVPNWMPGLPLAVDAHIADYYDK